MRDGVFLSAPRVDSFPRDRRSALSSGLRKMEMIPTSEIAAGVVHVVASNFGATEEEITLTVSRMLGFKATSAPFRKMIGSVVDKLLESGELSREAQMIVASSNLKTEVSSTSVLALTNAD